MEPRKGDWLQVYSGKPFWPIDPRPEEIRIEDIAHALSMQCRFGGHSRVFYSVADHSLRVSIRVPKEKALKGLLHDASEAYIVDVPRPLKYLPGFKEYREREEHLQRMIYEKFGVDPSDDDDVKEADFRMLFTEKRDLLNPGTEPWYGEDMIDPYRERLVPLGQEQAERMFLNRFYHLTGQKKLIPVPEKVDPIREHQKVVRERHAAETGGNCCCLVCELDVSEEDLRL